MADGVTVAAAAIPIIALDTILQGRVVLVIPLQTSLMKIERDNGLSDDLTYSAGTSANTLFYCKFLAEEKL